MKAYKSTRANGGAWADPNRKYVVGERVVALPTELDGTTEHVHGRGLHVGADKDTAIAFVERWPFCIFECDVLSADIVQRDARIIRCKSLTVTRVLSMNEIFGPRYAAMTKLLDSARARVREGAPSPSEVTEVVKADYDGLAAFGSVPAKPVRYVNSWSEALSIPWSAAWGTAERRRRAAERRAAREADRGSAWRVAWSLGWHAIQGREIGAAWTVDHQIAWLVAWFAGRLVAGRGADVESGLVSLCWRGYVPVADDGSYFWLYRLAPATRGACGE